MVATLAESLAAGDSEAFAALYDRLAVRLLGAARTMTGSPATAEDVVQDLFVELARGRAAVKASGGIASLEHALDLVEAGASRLGTSRGIALMQALRA